MKNSNKDSPPSAEKTMITGDWATRRVGIGRTELLPDASLRVCSHSPDGFNWGYGGSGPAQLALAILLEVTHDQSFSIAHYQHFKLVVIASLPTEDFVLPLRTVTEWVNKVRRKENADPS